MAKHIYGVEGHQKQFISLFRQLTYRHQNWQVWNDFVTMAACEISSAFDRNQERNMRFEEVIKRYDTKERAIFPQLFDCIVEGLDADPEQDFLGDLFMQLELGNHWKGQFFTPYHLCDLMADVQTVDLKEQVERKGFISVNDPACGAGALLIAFANTARKKDVNYQEKVIFVAQDIDHTAAMMCYIQLSLLGCPGYVIVGDTLSSPPTEPMQATADVWYMPMYYSDIWHYRRMFRNLDSLFTSSGPQHKSQHPMSQKWTEEQEEDTLALQLTLF